MGTYIPLGRYLAGWRLWAEDAQAVRVPLLGLLEVLGPELRHPVLSVHTDQALLPIFPLHPKVRKGIGRVAAGPQEDGVDYLHMESVLSVHSHHRLAHR